ncbi:NHL repeat-containing protein [candidate division KSB1 bacterium]|nr:NHL repeat-containing protein [candidate division KSB1 bacterium]
MNRSVNYLLLCLLIVGCADFGEKQPLPVINSQQTSFGANDTTYIRLLPDWSAEEIGANLSKPTDIVVGRDGYIFVADQGNDRIVVLNKSGQVQSHSNLNKIVGIPHPAQIAIDSKMNLFIVNGTNKIYSWNQYLNYANIDSIIARYVVRDTTTNEQFTYTFAELANAREDTTRFLQITDLIFSSDAVTIDSLLNVSVFYDDPSEDAEFYGVAAGPYGKDFIYVTDAGKNRILKINVVQSGYVLLKQGWINPTYTSKFDRVVVTHGSGAGTVDTPGSMTTDSQGNLYFTQTGGNFLVQKLSYYDYNSVYVLGEDPIMELRDPPLFVLPADIAVDADAFIYVVEKEPYLNIKTLPDSTIDSTYCYVHKFSPDGRIVDLGNKGIATTEFDSPQAIAIDDEQIIYIANTDKNRIDRFKLSVSEEDLPQEPR